MTLDLVVFEAAETPTPLPSTYKGRVVVKTGLKTDLTGYHVNFTGYYYDDDRVKQELFAFKTGDTQDGQQRTLFEDANEPYDFDQSGDPGAVSLYINAPLDIEAVEGITATDKGILIYISVLVSDGATPQYPCHPDFVFNYIKGNAPYVAA